MTQEDSVSLQKEHNSAEILVCEQTKYLKNNLK